MKKIIHWGLLITMVLGLIGFVTPAFASTPHNYTVLVGAENTTKGVSIMSYFPGTVRIHEGDSVTWKANSHEIHTVTFLAPDPLPGLIIGAPPNNVGAVAQINPLFGFPAAPAGGMYDGTTYANSGIMTTDPGGVLSFTLTFTALGTFTYECAVHGMMMSGTIQVVDQNLAVSSPAQVTAQGQKEMKAAWLTVPTAMAKAVAQIVPPVKNSDGSMTRTITMGYESGNIMFMRFFPDHITVKPGDTIVWKFSDTNTAPHTITFLNGTPDISFVEFLPPPDGPALLINPELMFPSQTVMQNMPLNNTDLFNSGLMMLGGQTSFSLKVGNISGTLTFQCLLHDTSGMVGSVFVTPSAGN